MRILVAEDDPISLKLITSILTKNSFEVVPAKTGKEAMEVLTKDNQFDLLISDVMMPEMDGFTLVSTVKKDKALKRIPIIMCTAVSEQKAVLKALELGVCDYITKPIKAGMLIEKVSNAIANSHGAVLIVDDEEFLLDLLKRTLDRAGYKVIPANSAEQALQILETHKVSVIISDITMPGISGFDLLATVKEKKPHLPVLLMTGYGGEHSKAEVLAAGADGYITKPFNNIEITLQLKKFVK